MTDNVKTFGTIKVIKIALTIFYIFGMWPRKNSSIWYTIAGSIFYLLTSFGWTTSKCIASFMLEKRSEIILLVPTSLYCILIAYRGFIIMWKYRTIEVCVTSISDFSLQDVENEDIQKKIQAFSKWLSAYMIFMIVALITVFLTPFLSTERIMPVPIWIPYLDWQASERDYYFGLLFSYIGISSMVFICEFTPILAWYLLYTSSLTLEVLGGRLRTLNNGKNEEEQLEELVNCIKVHQDILSNIHSIEESFASAFLLQIVTSAICICSVSYLMATESMTENFNSFIMYFSLLIIYGFEICVVIYYANQIALESDHLSFDVYASNWPEMSTECRKICLTYMSMLKTPKEIVVGKMFPMRMKLLSQILNTAYSIFNLLGKDNA